MLTDETPTLETPTLTWRAALDALGDIKSPPPEVLSWISSHWDEASSQLVARLAEFAAGGRFALSPAQAFCVVHLCGEKGETLAYPILCRMIAQDAGIADWLDDAVTETLPGVLIRVFDGDAAPLRRAIESEAGDAFARASALAALGYLVRAERAMTDAEMQTFLSNLRATATAGRESVLWLTWAVVAANLGYETMRFEAASLARDGCIPEGDFSRSEFESRVQLARSDRSGLNGFRRDRVGPLLDAISAVLSLAGRGGPEADCAGQFGA